MHTMLLAGVTNLAQSINQGPCSYHDLLIPQIIAQRSPTRNYISRQSRVFQASCQLLCLRVNHRTLDIQECTPTATKLRLHAFTFGVQMKNWQQRHILTSDLGLLCHTQAESRIINSTRWCTVTAVPVLGLPDYWNFHIIALNELRNCPYCQ
jgi:hypothetical protein